MKAVGVTFENVQLVHFFTLTVLLAVKVLSTILSKIKITYQVLI